MGREFRISSARSRPDGARLGWSAQLGPSWDETVDSARGSGSVSAPADLVDFLLARDSGKG